MIKFRAWHKDNKEMLRVDVINLVGECIHVCASVDGWSMDAQIMFNEIELMQYTGLIDKSGLHELYEGDIIDQYGNLAGNIYEDSGLYTQEAYYIITPICCKAWPDTYKEIIKRGCRYA